MPEAITSVLATPGLGWLVLAVVVAGLVRGFSGFGGAMIYLPVAARWLSPFEAITTLAVMEMIGPLPNAVRALCESVLGDVARLVLGMVIALPIGISILALVAPEVFRYGVSISSFGLLALLIAGFRYRGVLSRGVIFGTGFLGGLSAGCVGLPGPPVIMLYMGADHPPRVIRSTLMLYLFMADLVMLATLWGFGHLVISAIGVGLLLGGPYMVGNLIGARIFRPEAERTYRAVAYMIIAASGLSGLPLWD